LSGIGKACALAAAKEGANVAIAYRKSAAAVIAVEDMKYRIPNAFFIDCDVSVFAQVQAAVEKVVGRFGKLDVALNCAGIGGEPNKLGEMSEHAWLNVIGINLNGVFNCMRHQLAQMAKQHAGVIVNISSILGKVGFAGAAHYVAAKHGIIGLTQTAALEYAKQGIRVNAICPGFVDTPMIAKTSIGKDSAVEQRIIDLHPMGRFGKPDEIANGFMFLACAESSFITGTTLNIDGGFLAD
jgi:NAD(P)-dependent dehydrogenase (short-subunit alcohol dehydrogenase family)